MSRITNDKGLYLGRYLLNYLEGDNKVYNDNGNKMDFRLNNLVLKTQGEINSLAKRVRKPAVLKPASEFFKDEPKELLIQHPYNSYVILKLISTNEEYVKMHIKDSYHTIFNRESLDDVMKFNWYICNTYVGTKIPTSCTDPKILAFYKKGDCIYLHRYLIQLQGIEIPTSFMVFEGS
jgi:hypothetical protein